MSLLDIPPLTKDQYYRGVTMSLQDRAIVEGDWIGGGFVLGPTDYTAATFPNTSVIAFLYQADVDRALLIPSLTISANKNMVIRLQWGKTKQSSNLLGPAYVSNFGDMIANVKLRLIANAPITISPGIIRPLQGGTVALYIDSIADADKTNTLINVAGPAAQLTEDFNYMAERTALLLGDSISNGSGVTRKTELMAYNLIRGLKDTVGINLRYVNNSTGGYASGDHELERQYGRFDHYKQLDYLIYAHGTNDALRGSTASYLANAQTMYAFARKKWGPKLKFIVVGAPPLNNNANETALASIRAAQASWVTGAGDANLLYLNFAGAGTFDRTVITNYANSDGTHPVPSAQATVIANIINPWITANAAQLAAF